MDDELQIELRQLRAEVAELLADAVRVNEASRVETERVQREHADDVANLTAAISSRDVIGQAKGIIMATMHCNDEQAFDLLRAQSQAENRKLVDIATELASRASHRPG